MRSTIILVSAFGRDPMPSAFLFPKTNILEHSHAQILTCLPFHHPLIRLIILNLYEFSLQCLCFCISVFKLCLVYWCFTIFKATGMSCPLYFPLQSLMTDLTDVRLLWLNKGSRNDFYTVGRVPYLRKYYNAKYFTEWSLFL